MGKEKEYIDSYQSNGWLWCALFVVIGAAALVFSASALITFIYLLITK